MVHIYLLNVIRSSSNLERYDPRIKTPTWDGNPGTSYFLENSVIFTQFYSKNELDQLNISSQTLPNPNNHLVGSIYSCSHISHALMQPTYPLRGKARCYRYVSRLKTFTNADLNTNTDVSGCIANLPSLYENGTLNTFFFQCSGFDIEIEMVCDLLHIASFVYTSTHLLDCQFKPP